MMKVMTETECDGLLRENNYGTDNYVKIYTYFNINIEDNY